MSLVGNELVEIYGVGPTGQLAAIPDLVTTQELANLASGSPFGSTWYVSKYQGSDTSNNGRSSGQAFATIQKAVDSAGVGDTIVIALGAYDETVTIPRPSTGSKVLTIIGSAPVGSVAITPSDTDANALVNNADDVTIVNVGLASVGTGTALINTGARLRLISSKLENDDGTGYCAQFTLGTVIERDDGDKGGGADCRIQDCELTWAANGILITGTDYGAVTELAVINNYFHDLGTSSIVESVGSGGSAGVTYNSLLIQGNTFGRGEAGTEPTKYISLNADNANTGLATDNSFATDNDGGKNLVSTALIWSSNKMGDGISAAQPS